MPRIPTLALAVLAAAALGCVTMPAVDPGVHLRPETRPECVSACSQLGMDLGAIVLIRNAAGCVCQERTGQASAAPATSPGATAVAGGAYIVALAEEQQRQEEQHRQEEQQRQEKQHRQDEQRREDEARQRSQTATPPPGTPGSSGWTPGHP